MTIAKTILTGVLSGVLTAAVIHLLINVFRFIILPWYRRIIYNGIDVSGEWHHETELPGGIKESSTMMISQSVEKVSSLLTISQTVEGKGGTTLKTYKLKGHIKERFILLSGDNIDPKSIGVCSLLLQVVGGGDELEGCDSYYNVMTKSIMNDEVLWKRTNKRDQITVQEPQSPAEQDAYAKPDNIVN